MCVDAKKSLSFAGRDGGRGSNMCFYAIIGLSGMFSGEDYSQLLPPDGLDHQRWIQHVLESLAWMKTPTLADN